MTGQALTRPVALTPNVALRHSIEDWAQQHAIFLLVWGSPHHPGLLAKQPKLSMEHASTKRTSV